jgi:PDZ domain
MTSKRDRVSVWVKKTGSDAILSAHNRSEPALVEVPGRLAASTMRLIEALGIIEGSKEKADDSLRKAIKTLEALRNRGGVLVTNIGPNSQAAKAGMARGDILLQYDGIMVQKSEALEDLSERTSSSKTVTIRGLRGEKKLRLEVSGGRLGITVQNLSGTPPTLQ